MSDFVVIFKYVMTPFTLISENTKLQRLNDILTVGCLHRIAEFLHVCVTYKERIVNFYTNV